MTITIARTRTPSSLATIYLTLGMDLIDHSVFTLPSLCLITPYLPLVHHVPELCSIPPSRNLHAFLIAHRAPSTPCYRIRPFV
ncbi:hypothetical protein A4X09_0g4089 [Tilletia walkeri]|uniref:Uncharacterized protein n=1 Tax=Tilletia walkeri TaxID=117179 RepID=A0A8X7N6S0_9BASI|nr:hypothetical protein A4X09_0g4089 [Tilletia walkeri]